MKKVFLVSLDGTGVTEGHLIVGFVSRPSKNIIRNYIKNKYEFTLQDLLPNELNSYKGYYRKYTTDNPDVNVCVEICYNLNQYEDE